MSDQYQQELDWAITAVRQAAEICRNVQRQITPDIMEKKDRSPVTIADFASQAAICRHLMTKAPDDAIVGEEDATELRKPENAPFVERIESELKRVGIEPAGEDLWNWIDRGNSTGGTGRFWTLDPIDGTKGFISGRQYAISLALIVDGQIKVGVLGCPNLPVSPEQDEPAGVLLTAVHGAGAMIVPLDEDAMPSKITVSAIQSPAEACFCESAESAHSSHSRSARIAERLNITRPAVRLDSQAKYAEVARGVADIYFRLPARKGYVERIWDHAGGVLVVEEAGGVVTDIDGRPLEFQHGIGLSSNRGVLVTNGQLHEQVLEAVAATADSETP
ncbi:MAG: 3'(2'),5'-bisphosphate nucleotidase [Planctomycetaceae bacterium]|jgi:3'(2'), 5'-bisphosphate nucleotidase|nr:3'(2'),5'-bisphosphate nucleotidase [Planctomycetaceae bacterium]MBT6485104.1 3'(2'),5'-bisphosphate nucleotidase [Planctomycetaceae bacterium]MBT6495917.1 3'(2'),5'-bisphosphate nucleotidase [Planctomycetaceae bacterium]